MKLRTLSPSLALLPILLFAQDGTLDASFGNNGLLISDAFFADDQVQGVVVQDDGKVVAAGYADDGITVRVLLQRFLQDGSPDPDFNAGAPVIVGTMGELRYGYGVDLQSDGRIVVAGVIYDASMDGNAMLMRYLPNGTADPNFGTNGLVSSDLGAGAGFQSAWALRVLPDDRIMIVGENGENGVSCARFLADGTLDDTFGVNGVASTGVPFGSGLCMAMESGGDVIIGGYRILDGLSDWLLARFRPNGVLDPAFGDGGITTTDLGSDDIEMMRGISVFPDGRIVACGYRGNTGQDHIPALAMYNATGHAITTFGSNGVLLLPFTTPQWGQARAVIAQADNKMLLAGSRAEVGSNTNNDFFLYRLLADGTPDPSFTDGGHVYTDVSGNIDQAMAMAISPNGSVVLGGYAVDGDRNMALARYFNTSNTGIASLPPATQRVYPVPANDHVFIDGALLGAGTIQANLFGTDGRIVHVAPLTSTTTGNALRIELPNSLAAGTYVIQLRTNTAQVETPIVVDQGR